MTMYNTVLAQNLLQNFKYTIITLTPQCLPSEVDSCSCSQIFLILYNQYVRYRVHKSLSLHIIDESTLVHALPTYSTRVISILLPSTQLRLPICLFPSGFLSCVCVYVCVCVLYISHLACAIIQPMTDDAGRKAKQFVRQLSGTLA